MMKIIDIDTDEVRLQASEQSKSKRGNSLSQILMTMMVVMMKSDLDTTESKDMGGSSIFESVQRGWVDLPRLLAERICDCHYDGNYDTILLVNMGNMVQ